MCSSDLNFSPDMGVGKIKSSRTAEAGPKSSTIIINRLSILPDAKVDDSVINMPPSKMRRWVREAIIPALEQNGNLGVTTSLAPSYRK